MTTSPLDKIAPLNVVSAESEARHLLRMADDIVFNIPQTAKPIARWKEELCPLVGDPVLETVRGERELDRLAMKLRDIWMKIAHTHSAPHLKSPLADSKIEFPLGRTSSCGYERVIYPTDQEKRCETYRPTPRGWRSRHLLFRSGMAAITSLIQNVRPHLFGRDSGPIILDYFGGYFETKRVFDLFSSPLMSFRRHETQEQLLQAIEEGEGQLLFVEPVSYDWEMEALDLDKILVALSRRKRLPKMIIIDTTIIGNALPLSQLLSKLPGTPPPILMQISSGLKLDQEGLELANAGIVSLFWSKTDESKAASTLFRKMRSSRHYTGSGLSVSEIALLDVPWFLNRDRFNAHCRVIFENNRLLANSLAPVVASSNGVFSHVSHPSLTEFAHLPWAVAPFVVFHFREDLDSKENHAKLTASLSRHSRKEGLGFGTGASFGFRGHRYEIIEPYSVLHPSGQAKGVLKVAMGCRRGPVRDEIIRFMKTIASSSAISGDI